MRQTRRGFLKGVGALGIGLATSAAGRAAGSEEKRDRLNWPKLKLEPTGARIESIETFTRERVGLVRIRSNDGGEGWGQIAPSDADISATVLHRRIAKHVLGKDPGQLDEIVDRCIEANYKFPWSYVCRALAGVDTAIWDLLGKRRGKSVCELLGQRRKEVAVYGSSMRRDITPEAEAKRMVRLREQKGFKAFKVRIGKVCGHDQDQWPGRSEAVVATVRKAIGKDVALMVDANSCYTPKKAIEIGRMLEAHGVCHFEEPCPYWELEWTAEVTAALKVPVAGGEQDNNLAQWRRMIRMRAVDIVQPDVCYVGGLSRALRVAAMAGQAGLLCVPHSSNRTMVSVFTVHMLGAIANAGPFMEYSIEPAKWTEGLYEPALEVREGKVAVPTGPGWGVRIDEKWLERAERKISKL